jgi:hypothetical protein
MLYGIQNDLYESPTSIVILFGLVYYVETIFRTTYRKEEVEIKSYVTMVIRYM